jgi:hypothetical protein
LYERLLDSERIGQDKRLEGKKKSLMTNNQACKIICFKTYRLSIQAVDNNNYY